MFSLIPYKVKKYKNIYENTKYKKIIKNIRNIKIF